MEKTVELKLSSGEAARIATVIAKCDDALKRIFREMKKDQAEIEKLGMHTRAVLEKLKAA